jgi:hypothetical protein
LGFIHKPVNGSLGDLNCLTGTCVYGSSPNLTATGAGEQSQFAGHCGTLEQPPHRLPFRR